MTVPVDQRPVDQRPVGAPWPPPTVAPARLPAGWYEDPRRDAALRWWDGAGWTDHCHGLPRAPLRAALVGLAVLVVARVGVELATWPLDPDAVPLWLVATAFYVVVFGAMVLSARRWLWSGRSLVAWLRGQVRTVDLGWGLLVWLSTIASGVLVASLLLALDVPTGSNAQAIDVFRERDTGLYVVTVLAAVIGAPLVEELFFRGLLLRGALTVLPAWAAIGAQGLLFGVYHLIPSFGAANIGLIILLSVYGCVFGVWTHRTGRLGPVMVGHVVLNAVVLVASAAT